MFDDIGRWLWCLSWKQNLYLLIILLSLAIIARTIVYVFWG
jgi:hypothetical protein